MKKLIACLTCLLFVTVTSVSARRIVRGDANSDGSVTMADADLILAYILDPTIPISHWAADVSGDGTISAYDAALVMQMVEAGGY